MSRRLGPGTVEFTGDIRIESYAAIVGKKEKEGPLGDYFEHFEEDTTLGKPSWEKSETELQRRTFALALDRRSLSPSNIDMLFGGDLLNQCIASGYAFRETGLPFLGLYGACSTMALSLAMASAFCEGGAADRAAAITSSHFCAAERQYRFPLEYGGFRAPASQWTVTGSGCLIVSRGGKSPIRVRRASFGAVRDLGLTDMNNMGCAMAPAACDTLTRYFKDTGTSPKDYGAVVTGDLGKIGSEVFCDLCSREGYEVSNHLDCGKLIYDTESQKVGSGGSGCGCSASVLAAYFLPQLERGEMKSLLFMATGALMSPTSFQQGESIPGIAHLVFLESEKN
ncbi:MAG: stage V sporulation protein AD [Oscillospiraceae bacterium]|nr:stage V sporulation protein AD [Oscillospiraceae bacterium]